jgi:putative endopeptidase
VLHWISTRLRPLLLAACALAQPALADPPPSGVNLADLDPRVRAQDDFYGHAVGGWMARVRGPDYMPGWSAGRELQLGVYEALERDVQALIEHPDHDADHRRLADFHAAYMDLARIDANGLRPLGPDFRRIEAATSPGRLVRVIAGLSARGLDIGVGLWVHPDDEAPTRYLADFVQSDLGLPERDDYVAQDDSHKALREAWRAHVERVLALTGARDAARQAEAILDLETRLADAQWTQVATRVPGATTHRLAPAQLAGHVPGFDLAVFARGLGIPAAARHFNLSQPGYLVTYGRLLRDTPASVWQAYLEVRLVDHLARVLPAPYRDEADRFYTRTLQGATGTRPRWLRAMGAIEAAMGDALGALYVRNHFTPAAKARAEVVLADVVATFRQRFEDSDWLGDASKRGALAKLDQLVIRLGAPPRTRSYASLRIAATDPVGNALRAQALATRREIDKLARPVDREEWTMTAQSVNGYYSVSRNQVVLPAALLQPPYFQADADDAVNYGGLGFFIAHELTHAFDRAGSRYDGAGRRVEWMSAPDRAEFERRAHALIAQYDGYELAPGRHLDGELTIGENIADTSGLAIAHAAYLRAQQRRPPQVLDGLGADQRFFLGFARIWAAEPLRTAADVRQALADTHAPERWRVNGAVMNQDAFHAAFDTRPGDAMFLAPDRRTRIW